MMNQNDRRAQICAMYFLNVDDANIENYPGSKKIIVAGDWIDLCISSAEFTEKREHQGEPVQQELSAKITDVSSENEALIADITAKYGLIRLDYTNDDQKVIGTDVFPVQLSYEKSGSPAVISLSYKGSSSELSKFLQSF